MKNQYFGDTRDLFKYDLALRVIWGIPSLRSFTFVPMLTPDDGSRHGSRTDLRGAGAGSRNRPLVRYLEGCIRDGRRDIREIRPFFRGQGIPVELCRAGFTRRERARYFRSLPDPWLRDALVLLDPDVGLEVARPTEKHLLFSEAGDLLGRLQGSSVLMIFQYLPRVERTAYLHRRIGELRAIAPEGTAALSGTRVAFFFLGQEPGIMEQVRDLLAEYRGEYPGLILVP